MQNFTVQCLSEAVSPISHMSGTVGNEGIVAREPVRTPRGVMMVPFLSGNALRHRAIRGPMALWLIEQYGLKGKLSLLQLNFLLHGGNLTKSNAVENTRRIAEMHELWPMLRLLGGSLQDQILCGSLDCWRGTLICEENRRSLERLIPGLIPEDRLFSSEVFLSGTQYTRGDAKKTNLMAASDRDDTPTNLMIYSGQAVTRGALFYHGFVLKHVNELELGCLLFALELWQQGGGTIGGSARLGHGRLKTEIVDLGIDTAPIIQAYIDHALSVKDRAIEWLNDAFTSKSDLRANKIKKSKEGALSE
jgi:hypothetical protein